MSSTVRPPTMATLILLSALAIIPINIFLPSLTRMADEFDVPYSVAGMSLTAYAAVSVCLQLVMGPLSDRVGRRPVILGGLVIFIAASIGCSLATDIEVFLACRMIQAVIAPTFAVSLAIIRDTTGREQAASKIGYVAMAWALAPMLGPTLGGGLEEFFGWRASFLFLAAAGVGVLTLCWIDLRETNINPTASMTEQFRAYPELLGSPRFWSYSICMGFSVGGFYAFLAGAPLAAGAGFDLPPALVGIYMGSITGGFMAGSFLSGRFAARFQLTQMILAGRLLACAGMLLGLVLYAAGLNHPMALFGPCMFVGISNGLTMPSANSGAISVRPALMGSAAGLASAIATSGGVTMSLIASTVLTEDNARYGLILVMLGSSAIALVAGFNAHRLEKIRAATSA